MGRNPGPSARTGTVGDAGWASGPAAALVDTIVALQLVLLLLLRWLLLLLLLLVLLQLVVLLVVALLVVLLLLRVLAGAGAPPCLLELLVLLLLLRPAAAAAAGAGPAAGVAAPAGVAAAVAAASGAVGAPVDPAVALLEPALLLGSPLLRRFGRLAWGSPRAWVRQPRLLLLSRFLLLPGCPVGLGTTSKIVHASPVSPRGSWCTPPRRRKAEASATQASGSS